MIARVFGLARQSVQRTADALERDGLTSSRRTRATAAPSSCASPRGERTCYDRSRRRSKCGPTRSASSWASKTWSRRPRCSGACAVRSPLDPRRPGEPARGHDSARAARSRGRGSPATASCSPRRSVTSPPRRRHTRRRPTAPRRATTRGATSWTPCTRPAKCARRFARSGPTCSRRAGAASRGPRSSTASPARGARDRSRRFPRRRQASARACRTPGWPAGFGLPPRASTASPGSGCTICATGRYAGHEADTRFPAASTVKLGALVAALRASPQPGAQPLVVGRPADRLLVVEPGREPHSGQARSRRGRRRPAPPGHGVEHVPGAVPGDDGPAAWAALARDHRARSRSCSLPAPRRRARRCARPRPARADATAGNGGSPRARFFTAGRGQRRPAASVASRACRWPRRTAGSPTRGRRRRLCYHGGGATIVVVEVYRPGVGLREAQLLGRDVLRAAGLAK